MLALPDVMFPVIQIMWPDWKTTIMDGDLVSLLYWWKKIATGPIHNIDNWPWIATDVQMADQTVYNNLCFNRFLVIVSIFLVWAAQLIRSSSFSIVLLILISEQAGAECMAQSSVPMAKSIRMKPDFILTV